MTLHCFFFFFKFVSMSAYIYDWLYSGVYIAYSTTTSAETYSTTIITTPSPKTMPGQSITEINKPGTIVTSTTGTIKKK